MGADGQRFLLLAPEGDPLPLQDITVVLNWQQAIAN